MRLPCGWVYRVSEAELSFLNTSGALLAASTASGAGGDAAVLKPQRKRARRAAQGGDGLREGERQRALAVDYVV